MAAIFSVMTYLRTGRSTFMAGAAGAIALAFIFDFLDGRVARVRQTNSVMGRELDSLSDVISFGAAPAAMAFGAGLDGGWDQLILIGFVACGVSRLARFNVTAESLAAGGDKVKYFEGTPIPSSIILVGMLLVATLRARLGAEIWWGVVELGPARLHPLVLLFGLSGGLMISKTLRIPKL
ncbi:MAG TPA: CDP-alcohol phosphatidyltransferase family protein [Polyangia bacterium]